MIGPAAGARPGDGFPACTRVKPAPPAATAVKMIRRPMRRGPLRRGRPAASPARPVGKADPILRPSLPSSRSAPSAVPPEAPNTVRVRRTILGGGRGACQGGGRAFGPGKREADAAGAVRAIPGRRGGGQARHGSPALSGQLPAPVSQGLPSGQLAAMRSTSPTSSGESTHSPADTLAAT